MSRSSAGTSGSEKHITSSDSMPGGLSCGRSWISASGKGGTSTLGSETGGSELGAVVSTPASRPTSLAMRRSSGTP